MKLVIDTNILLISISRYSQYHWIFEAILEGRFTLCVTTEILYEYEEIINRIFNKETADYTITSLLNLPNLIMVFEYLRWNIIKVDYDDNKFVDCAISSNADYIVTNDKHFNVVKEIEFPSVNIISLAEFEIISKELSN